MAQSLANSIFEEDKQFIAPLYGKANIEFVRGEGSYLFDKNGKKYLDFVAGIAVNALGHQNAEIKKAVEEQMDSFFHISNLYPNYPQVNLAKALLAATVGEHREALAQPPVFQVGAQLGAARRAEIFFIVLQENLAPAFSLQV